MSKPTAIRFFLRENLPDSTANELYRVKISCGRENISRISQANPEIAEEIARNTEKPEDTGPKIVPAPLDPDLRPR